MILYDNICPSRSIVILMVSALKLRKRIFLIISSCVHLKFLDFISRIISPFLKSALKDGEFLIKNNIFSSLEIPIFSFAACRNSVLKSSREIAIMPMSYLVSLLQKGFDEERIGHA